MVVVLFRVEGSEVACTALLAPTETLVVVDLSWPGKGFALVLTRGSVPKVGKGSPVLSGEGSPVLSGKGSPPLSGKGLLLYGKGSLPTTRPE